MIVKHFRKDFYENLIGNRVLLVVHSDVDAACACKILLELFRVDGVSYSLLVVDGIGRLKSKFRELGDNIKIVIMINCGAGVDILQLLERPTDKIFYVMDNHRPIHIANYYNETNQIRLLILEDKIDIPAFDDIFMGDMSDSDSDDDMDQEMNSDEDVAMHGDDEEGGGLSQPTSLKRKRTREPRKDRRSKAAWLKNRDELLFQYTQYASYSLPSALLALELSWSKSRDDSQFVWWAIIALTDAFVMNRLTRRDYTLKAADLHAHIARITHSQTTPRDCLKISFENELCFYLYRHWNLYDSMRMTPYSASTLKTWSLKGEKRFHELLGELGLPLTQCKQKFTSMDLNIRRTLKESFSSDTIKDKYKFDLITVASFIAEIGFRAKYSAFDGQLATLALLENPDRNLSMTDKFLEALEGLSKTRRPTLDKGLNMAKIFMQAMYRQVQTMINTNSIGPRGEYLHAHVPEGAPDVSYFKNTNSLLMLGHFIQQAVLSSCRSRRWLTMPMVVTAPYDNEWWSLVGIRPMSTDRVDNLFGKLFEALARRMEDKVLLDAFDPNIILVRYDERYRFLELLEACLV